MPFGLTESTVARIRSVFKASPLVQEVVLYGSRAKGNYKPGSDIDLTIKGRGLTLRELNKLTLALDDLLLPYTFDLSIHSMIENPDLLDHIDRVGVTIFKRQIPPSGENPEQSEA